MQEMMFLNAIVVFIFIVAGCKGFQIGLVRSLIPCISFVLSLMLLTPFTAMLEPYIGPVLEQNIKPVASMSIDIARDKLEISDQLPDGAAKEITKKAEDSIQSVAEGTVAQMMHRIIRLILLIISNAIITIVLMFLFSGFNIIQRIPIISDVNRILGAAIGVIGRYIEVCLVITLILIAGTIFPVASNIYNNMQKISALSFIMEHNFINYMFY